jgi:hypothetical protein
VTELKTTLRTNSDVKGRVIVEGNATSLDLRSIRIGLRRKERLPTLVGGTLLSSAQLANPSTGEFTLAGLQESRFGVTVAGLPQDAYVSDVRQNGRSVFDEGIVVDGTAAPLEITLNLQGGSVTGVVRDATATPSARTTVTLVPAVARRGNPQYYKRAITDPNGQFTFRGVAPGEYKLFAWVSPPPGQAEENAQFISTYEGRGTAASVTPGGASNLQLTVIATQ